MITQCIYNDREDFLRAHDASASLGVADRATATVQVAVSNFLSLFVIYRTYLWLRTEIIIRTMNYTEYLLCTKL